MNFVPRETGFSVTARAFLKPVYPITPGTRKSSLICTTPDVGSEWVRADGEPYAFDLLNSVFSKITSSDRFGHICHPNAADKKIEKNPLVAYVSNGYSV